LSTTYIKPKKNSVNAPNFPISVTHEERKRTLKQETLNGSANSDGR